MMNARSTIRRRPLRGRPRRSFTLVEAVISIVLVGVMLVAAINTLGATAVSKRSIEQQMLGNSLAQDLMAEILNEAYEEPDDAPNFGRETGEGVGSRANWDDVDDYAGWSKSPPKAKDDTPLSGFDAWTRSVEVVWVKPADLTQVASAKTGIKRISVTVSRNDGPATELVAIRTHAWPKDRMDPGVDVLLVVTSTVSPTAQEQARQVLMELWGFTVNLIRESDSQLNFDAAVIDANIAYVPEGINEAVLNTKLRDTLIGVVCEEADLGDEFGFAGAWTDGSFSSQDLQIVDNTHYITQGLTIGSLIIFTSDQPVHMLDWPYAPDLQTLGRNWDANDSSWRRSLAVIETGGDLEGGGTAAGRRVRLPWGLSGFDIIELNKDGRDLMKRSIEWAAKKEQP